MTESAPRPRRQRDPVAKRAAVLTAAGLCFAREGYTATTTGHIAREAGVSKGTVFHLFGSKERLFSAVIEDCLENWSTVIEERAALSGDNALDELHSMFMASFDYARRNPVIRLFDNPEESMLATYREEINRRNNRWRKRVLATLNRGVSQKLIRQDLDARRLALVFHELQGALHSGAMLGSSQQHHDAKTVTLAIDVFLRGIRT